MPQPKYVRYRGLLYRRADASVIKTGPKGGQIIGYTTSRKPIYAPASNHVMLHHRRKNKVGPLAIKPSGTLAEHVQGHLQQAQQLGYTAQDHKDAAKLLAKKHSYHRSQISTAPPEGELRWVHHTDGSSTPQATAAWETARADAYHELAQAHRKAARKSS